MVCYLIDFAKAMVFMENTTLQAINLDISTNKLEKISKIAEAQYQTTAMWHAGGALGNSVAIRKIKFWDNEQICVSGFFSSLHHLKVYLSLPIAQSFRLKSSLLHIIIWLNTLSLATLIRKLIVRRCICQGVPEDI